MGIQDIKSLAAAARDVIFGAPDTEPKTELEKIPDTLQELENITNAALRDEGVEVAYQAYSYEQNDKLIMNINATYSKSDGEDYNDEYPKTIAAAIFPSEEREGGFFVSMSTSDDPVNQSTGKDTSGRPIESYAQALDVIIREHKAMLPQDLQDRLAQSGQQDYTEEASLGEQRL